MKKVKIGALLAVVVIIAAVIVKIGMNSTATPEVEQPEKITSELIKAKLNAIAQEKEDQPEWGSAENPFIILEIVPHEMIGDIGYMIPGQEPIDLEEVKKEYNDLALYVGLMGDFVGADPNIPKIVEMGTQERIVFPDEVPLGSKVDRIDQSWLEWGWEGTSHLMAPQDQYVMTPNYGNSPMGIWIITYDGHATAFSGYYERVDNQSGKFNRVETAPGEYSFEFSAEGGDYIWVTQENTDHVEYNPDAPRVWTTRTGNWYYKKTENTIKHNDNLVKNIFGKTSSEIVTQVVTVTPDQFQNMDNLQLVQCADMIYIHADTSTGSKFQLWRDYNKKGIELTVEEYEKASAMSFADNDLTWDTALAIAERMAEEDRPALIMDDNAKDLSNAGERNIYKLVMMVRMYGPKLFKELYLDTGKVYGKEIDGQKVGVLAKSDNIELVNWDIYSFYPEGAGNDPAHAAALGMKHTNFTGEDEYGLQWNMIEDNMYFYQGGTAFFTEFLQPTLSENGNNEEAFDYFEEKYEYRPNQLTGAEIMEYLLRKVPTKRKLKILEIQPCNQFVYLNQNNTLSKIMDWKTYYRNILPWFEKDLEKDVEVITMPTWEFISSVEDLNSEYDAIIFGGLQDESNGGGKNGYADWRLNVYWNGYNPDGFFGQEPDAALIYTSVGDIVSREQLVYDDPEQPWEGTRKVVYPSFKGNQADESTRYSGNDITGKKLEELKDFMDGGKPIILDQALITKQSIGSVILNKEDPANKEAIDRQSYMYQLVDLYRERKDEGLFIWGSYQSSKLKKKLAYENCKLEVTNLPEPYTYDAVTQEIIDANPDKDLEIGQITNVRYADRNNFQYEFKIIGKTNQRYGVRLYIDADGDGVYSGSLKERQGTAKSEQVLEAVIKDRDGRMTDSNQLYAGQTYTLTKKLESMYQGILPWKLEVYMTDNTSTRSNEIGYSAVHTSEGQKTEEIRVLQMNLTKDMTDTDKITINMADHETFQKYLRCVEEYNVQIDYLSNTEWMEIFGDESVPVENRVQAWKNYLDDYNMLILGFRDNCTYTDNEVYHEGFKDFVSQGKSVIISHDMAGDTSLYDEENIVQFKEELRVMMGMRRFNTNEIMVNNNQVNLINMSMPETTAVMKEDGTVVPGLMDNALWLYYFYNSEDNADTAVSDRDVSYKARHMPDKKGDKLKDSWAAMETFEDGQITGYANTTQFVNIVNKGQITNYPYNIPDMIRVAPTHAQKFQLDMEENLVVWYTLTDVYSEKYQERAKGYMDNSSYYFNYNADKKSTTKETIEPIPNYENYFMTGQELGRGIYSSRESDGRNSYYIYSKGNITYTGLGHRGEMPDEEIQLFINTMIAAYRRAAAAPKIEVTNEDKIVNGNENILYITLDNASMDQEGRNLDVYFKVTDPSLTSSVIASRSYALQCKHITETGEEAWAPIYANNTITGKNPGEVLTDPSFISTDNSMAAWTVYNNGEYYFQVPYNLVKENGSVEFELVLDSEYVNSNNNVIHTNKSTKVIVMPMPLFNLN